MVCHHNTIFEFMRIFNRTEFVHKKPVYCWAAAVEIGINMTPELKEQFDLNTDFVEDRNQLFSENIEVLDFKIINE